VRNGRKQSLQTKLSLNIALVALLTVALISVLSNVFIKRRFESYIVQRQQQEIADLLLRVEQQYDPASRTWDVGFLHAIGMYALRDGYIVKIYDRRGKMLWDAETCDMALCMQIVEDVSQKMQTLAPSAGGAFATLDFPLTSEGRTVGKISVSHFAPYFLSDGDALFLDALNAVFIGCGLLSLAFAAALGRLLARNVSLPIRKAADAAKRMSEGDYAARIEGGSRVRELDELTLSVNRLAQALGRQENLRRQLTADVAHELRTPLTTVGTHIEAMTEGLWEPTRERLSSCREEIERIGGLVSDMESLARVESDNLKLDRDFVNLRELAEKTLRSFEARIAEKNLNVSAEGDCRAWADRKRMRQVLTNLLSNAVKYTPPGGTVRVVLSETDDSALLAVEDDGIGISEEDLPFVFERFYRADKSRSRASGGSGIGLAVVRSIVTAHGGGVKAERLPAGGSRFLVSLPRGRDAK
jgi:signal transduction histidine kinase